MFHAVLKAVEKALNDLIDLESTGAIKNPLVTRSIESKLPDNLKRDWLTFMVNPSNGITPDNRFDSLLTFLKTQEDILEKLDQLGVSERSEKKPTYLEKKYAELTSVVAERFRKAFTNMAAKSHSTEKNTDLPGVMDSNTCELPVILMLLEVTANAGQKIGTLIDLASDTNYITHRAARRLKLQSEKITLVVHGVGGMAMKVKTKRYLLKVKVKTPRGMEKAHELICYGLDEIAKVHRVIKPQQLK